jgi:3-oxoacyl-[acyl-carrier protein] reductase
MDTEQALAGQVAVVTGAGRGIGAAIARKLAKLGAVVVLCGRTQSTLDRTAQAILEAGGKAEVIPCDVTLLHQFEYAAARVESTFGRLDILVNNAGLGGFNDPLYKLAPAEWDRIPYASSLP